MEYVKGCSTRLSAVFSNLSGTPIDPTDVVVRVKPPSGNIITYTYGVDDSVVRDGVGAYHADVVLDTSGPWAYRWEAFGIIRTAAEGSIKVKPSSF